MKMKFSACHVTLVFYIIFAGFIHICSKETEKTTFNMIVRFPYMYNVT